MKIEDNVAFMGVQTLPERVLMLLLQEHQVKENTLYQRAVVAIPAVVLKHSG